MKNYGMFSPEGNAMIKGVILTAKSAGLSWDEVLDVLEDVATLDGFEEATDTSVREMVYTELNQ
jgi:hypothetical protein